MKPTTALGELLGTGGRRANRPTMDSTKTMTKPKITPHPTTEIGQLLGTEDRGQHPARVRELIQLANTSVLTIIVQVDSRTGRISVNAMDSGGGTVSYDVAHKLLDSGRSALVKMQTHAEAAAAKTEAPKAEVPAKLA